MPIIILVRGVNWAVKKGYKILFDHKEGKATEEQNKEEEEFRRAQPQPFMEHLVTPGPSDVGVNVVIEPAPAEAPISRAGVGTTSTETYDEPIDAETLALARSIQRERARRNSESRANQRETPGVELEAVDDDELPPPAYEEAIALHGPGPSLGSPSASAGPSRASSRPLPVPSSSPRIS